MRSFRAVQVEPNQSMHRVSCSHSPIHFSQSRSICRSMYHPRRLSSMRIYPPERPVWKVAYGIPDDALEISLDGVQISARALVEYFFQHDRLVRVVYGESPSHSHHRRSQAVRYETVFPPRSPLLKCVSLGFCFGMTLCIRLSGIQQQSSSAMQFGWSSNSSILRSGKPEQKHPMVIVRRLAPSTGRRENLVAASKPERNCEEFAI